MKFGEYLQSINESKTEELAHKSRLKVSVIDRFNKDSHVTLDELKELAKRHSVDYDTVLETVCDLFQGMIYRRKDIRTAKIDPKELEMGIAHEMEHTDNKDISEIIARDHLASVPNYYTLLKEIDDD